MITHCRDIIQIVKDRNFIASVKYAFLFAIVPKFQSILSPLARHPPGMCENHIYTIALSEHDRGDLFMCRRYFGLPVREPRGRFRWTLRFIGARLLVPPQKQQVSLHSQCHIPSELQYKLFFRVEACRRATQEVAGRPQFRQQS